MEDNHRVHWLSETGEIMICKTLHRKLTIEQNDTNLNKSEGELR